MDLEQEYVSRLYERLDELRKRASGRLATVLRQTGGTHQARTEREAFSALYSQQVAQFDAAENGLCFGRLDFRDGERRYIGRLGIHDDSDNYEQLLMDWRAAAARPFYLATAVSPEDVTLRRHITTRDRTVTGLDDEILDLASADPNRHEGLTGESALLAALSASRTGRMSDIVETIQAEQDHIIRSSLAGVLVVQGGPGTGKTAVALHRAAYLLYTHRRQLLRRGALVVGPNATFLRYIGQVLPSLGETSVLLSTVADLYPGVTATAAEPAGTAVLKGSLRMARLIAAAVRDWQQVPDDGLEVVVDRDRFRISKQACVQARERARRSRRPHNQARHVFVREMLSALTEQVTTRLGANVLGEGNLLDDADVAELRKELAADPRVRAAINELWPLLTPQRLLAELFSSERRLASAAPWLSPAERAMLLRGGAAAHGAAADGAAGTSAHAAGRTPGDDMIGDEMTSGEVTGRGVIGDDLAYDDLAGDELTDDDLAGDESAGDDMAGDEVIGGWTPADVPLLDEAAELLGEDDVAARILAERRRRAQVGYAQGVLDIMARDDEDDPELLMGADLVDASRLAARQEEDEFLTAAERAATDRTWAFGHVIVDEAQELSEMAWRMVMRRCPARSMTIVGDIAQTGDLAGATSWEQMLGPYLGDRWRLAGLTINYRTPAEIMAVAADVLAAIDPALELPRSVRESGAVPWRLEAEPAELADLVAAAAARAAAQSGDGRVAVIVPAARLAEFSAAVATTAPGPTTLTARSLAAAPQSGARSPASGPVGGTAGGADPDLESPVVVLTVRQAKGLEFDYVLIADPGQILAESPRGLSDLYVAMTRATQRLGVLHSGPPPGVLAGLKPVSALSETD
jgi:DNA helicase IV